MVFGAATAADAIACGTGTAHLCGTDKVPIEVAPRTLAEIWPPLPTLVKPAGPCGLVAKPVPLLVVSSPPAGLVAPTVLFMFDAAAPKRVVKMLEPGVSRLRYDSGDDPVGLWEMPVNVDVVGEVAEAISCNAC